jgi:hypothetical protein
LSPIKFRNAPMSPSAGLRKFLGSRASQKTLARRFPILWTKATCSGSQVSKVVDRTFEVSTPKDRCTPLQLRQTKTPRFTDAHVGPLAWQSAHLHGTALRASPVLQFPGESGIVTRFYSCSFRSRKRLCMRFHSCSFRPETASLRAFSLAVPGR